MSESALTISPKKFNELLEANERLEGKLKKAKEAGEEKAGLIVTGATIVTVEGLLGYMRGRYGEQRFADVPAEVWAGGALELGALSGLVGKHSEIVANAGHATLAFAVAFEMYKVGQEAATKDKSNGAKSEAKKEVVETRGETVEETPQQKRTEALPDARTKEVVTSIGRTMADDVPDPVTGRKTGT
jgi:hypothetical protein